jgi:fumarate hydratase subunit alpha
MGMFNLKKIEEDVKNCLVKAGTTFREDQIKAYRNAIKKENNQNAKWALEKIQENAVVAEKKVFPLCDDTGIPHVFAEIGENVTLPKGWLTAVNNGIIDGLRIMPGRPMAVRGNPIERVEQSRGLFEDPGRLSLAPVIIKPVSGDKLKITVLLLGGGPEIRAKTYRIFHKRSINVVLKESVSWVVSEVKSLGCTPCIPAIGIGRTHFEATALMIEAMKEGNLDRQNLLEKKITESVNYTGLGPLGLGGDFTAIGTFLKIGPLRASGVRIVSVRPCCCIEPRKATVTFGADK